MYLKKLEIVGFKSFLNKTTLNFEPGITAVVGPNGTGKSNVFDAIRWVLGEQSVKALRGSDMQDVIFNGTDSKEPLSMAEVSLTFDNSRRFFKVDHDEVMITRRIFRSSESEYLLNKSLVRLKDIQDLLAGTGIGAESYSLVAQGQIDLILSSRPEDRRLVFDEASGITKYKSQKKEAIRKLEETEQNLLRVNDIILEVKRQIGSLERQANKARRYKEIFEELKLKEVSSAFLEKIEFIKTRGEMAERLRELEGQESRIRQLIAEQEAEINNRQAEAKALEDGIMAAKNEILNLDNLALRNKQHISLNQERIKELEANNIYALEQISQVKNKLISDEEKLNNFKEEYASLKSHIDEKSALIKEKEDGLNNLTAAIKVSLANIAAAKKSILELVTKISNIKNEIADTSAKQQVHLARQKRLSLEKAKVTEDRNIIEESLKGIARELESLKKVFEGSSLKMAGLKSESEKENASLGSIALEAEQLERKRLTLESHREFIEKLKTKYEDIGEAMNAVIYLDKLPAEKLSGLVVKIKDRVSLSDEDRAYFAAADAKISGEAKPIDLDTQKISQTIEGIQKDLNVLKDTKTAKEARLRELGQSTLQLEQDLRSQEIALANKKNSFEAVSEQANKIREEEEIIALELADVEKEIALLEEKTRGLKSSLEQVEKEHKDIEERLRDEENNISLNGNLKEELVIGITQARTELEALDKRTSSDQATLAMLEDTCRQGREQLLNLEKQIQQAKDKSDFLLQEIKDLEARIYEADQLKKEKSSALEQRQEEYKKIAETTGDFNTKIDGDRKQLDAVKNKIYELQMQNKDIEYKFFSVKERILQNYKLDLETIQDAPQENDRSQLLGEIAKLKEKLDSLGNVNLVAIEEYDELKKRYDFLIQQQNDLASAKDSLHEAILKINRTTKKMFLETFELVRQEFRNYFKLLFNGGDAQIFLVDEHDPLESGIEIICRPPGKKLQNVLLLSGGEKALSATALIFAIFKVKPSPFCILDEIDAALDEANVDRFGRMLQEFIKQSQFIVITHNKKTIANADVMYGITMAESGVSKIVSVKFAQNNPAKDKEPDAAVAEPV